jgi:hypothetical protein
MKIFKREKCDCEEPSPLRWLPGILVGQPSKTGYRFIERCDLCERLSSDEAAGEVYAGIFGGRVAHDRAGKVIWMPP